MATLIANGDIVLVTLVSKVNEQRAITGCHFLASGLVGVAPQYIDVAVYFDTNVTTDFKKLMSTAAKYLQTEVRRVYPLPATEAWTAQANNGIGTSATDLLPTQVCGLLKKKSDIAGRKHRGRMYLPFPGEGHNDGDGRPNGSYTGLLGTFGSTFLTTHTVPTVGATGAIVLEPVIYHPTDHTVTKVTEAIVRYKWGTQRRRSDWSSGVGAV